MTRHYIRNILINKLKFAPNFVLYSIDGGNITVKFFNNDDYMNALNIIKNKKIHIIEKTKVQYLSDINNEVINKLYINFRLPSEYVIESPTTFWTMSDDAEAFELNFYLKNKSSHNKSS